MEYRRINNTIISLGSTNADTLKRNQYVSVIYCKLSGKSEIGNIFRMFHNRHTYYGVITESNTVIWYNVLSTASFLKEHSIFASDSYTNIAEAVTGPRKDAEEGPREETQYSLNSRSIVAFSSRHIFIEVSGKLMVYDTSGAYQAHIETGIDKLLSVECSLCGKYLFMQLEKGMLALYNLSKKEFVYRKRHPVGTVAVFGNVFAYARYFSVAKSSLIMGKVCDGEALLELTYPEQILCASTDTLHRRVAVGSQTGKVFYTRLDNVAPEFTEAKIHSSEITSISFSSSGRFIFATSRDLISVIDSKDGKVIKSIMNPPGKTFFTYTSSSNLHLQ
ncbi:uncharacterized protein NEMAJ01_2219 [Nematocida major]|uniref:uncharacterized protein n=1 Tax=Nematocida major TaxID=1912982 RepID=UPI002008EB84|nr:uncharacterized protein NEMAJ01_2219 [Nematocida major]KAH9387323.1 hypothetical protein NEMAJ01_2219 [Nematocida major]